MIGGKTDSGFTTSIYRLEHGGSQWKLMTQILKNGRTIPAVFLIPDSFAPNCTLS